MKNIKKYIYLFLITSFSWCFIFIIFYKNQNIDIRPVLFVNYIFNMFVIHHYLINHKKEFISNENQLQLYILTIYFIHVCLIYLVSFNFDLHFLIFFLVFSIICYINYKIRDYTYKWFFYIIVTVIYEYLLYLKMNFFFYFNFAPLLIGLCFFLYIKYNKITFFKEHWFLKDRQIVVNHFKSEFAYFNAINNSIFFIIIFMIALSDTPIFTSYRFILIYFLLLMSYIEFFIIYYCNPRTSYPWSQAMFPITTAAGSLTGGLFWIRESALNSENPIYIPGLTDKIQTDNWGYVASDRSAILAEKQFREKYPRQTMPTKEVTTFFGTTKHVDVKAIERRLFIDEELTKIIADSELRKKKNQNFLKQIFNFK